MTRADLLIAQAEALEWAYDLPWENEPLAIGRLNARIDELRAEAAKAADPQPVAPALMALAWSKARNTWIQASRHGTQEAADLLAIAELAHWLHPDPRIAEYRALLQDVLTDNQVEVRERIRAALKGGE